MARKLKNKYLVDASGVTPPLPPGSPRMYETWAYSEVQARRFIAIRLGTQLGRFVNRDQLVATEDTTAMPLVPAPRLPRTPHKAEKQAEQHPHVLQLPLFEGLH